MGAAEAPSWPSCSSPPAPPRRPPGRPRAAAGRDPVAAVGPPVSLNFEIPPAPGPVKPFRGAASEHVYLRDGLVSMYFELRNVGEEPITWLNTLYDYEPQQLYTPVVQLEWQQGGRAIYTRAGRFFPSPAILPPGETAVYIMGGQPTQGSGTPGDLADAHQVLPDARDGRRARASRSRSRTSPGMRTTTGRSPPPARSPSRPGRSAPRRRRWGSPSSMRAAGSSGAVVTPADGRPLTANEHDHSRSPVAAWTWRRWRARAPTRSSRKQTS